jgi:hypothetical protein
MERTLNASLDWSVDAAAFAASPELRENYTSADELCLTRRLMLRPFSMRPFLRDFVNHTFFTVSNITPENGEPDRDDDGELAHVHDAIQDALVLDDEDLFLHTFFNLMVIYPSLREAMAAQSNLYVLRCLMAFLRYGVAQINTCCVVSTNVRAIVHGFVEAARDLVLNGITTPALYLTFIHNHYASAEERIQHSNPRRTAPSVDVPAEHHLFSSFSPVCAFFRSPWEPHDAAGFARLRDDLGLPAHTVLEQGNMGASVPPTEAVRTQIIMSFYPEKVFNAPDVAADAMSIWAFVTFHTTLVRNNFRPPDPKMATRASRAVQRHVQQRAVAESRRRAAGAENSSGSEESDDD